VYAIEAARLGKHVLCEKPLEICLEWADAMIKACREHNVKLGVAYQRRFSSDNPLVKNLIDKGMLGRIFSVNLSVLNYRNNSYYQSAPYRGTRSLDGGGPFIQQASHYIDLYYWYFDKPEKINAYLGTFIHDIEVEDHGAVICRHSSGLISTITASTATKPGFPARLEIYSDKGYLVMENDVITRWEIEGLENPTVHTKSENQHTGSSSAIVNDTTNHERIINDFTDAVLNDREPLVNGEEARHATEIILEIYKNC
jgi:predicted dehydrogenase